MIQNLVFGVFFFKKNNYFVHETPYITRSLIIFKRPRKMKKGYIRLYIPVNITRVFFI